MPNLNSPDSNSGLYTPIVPECTICKETISCTATTPCRCNMHLQCFIDNLVKKQSSRCSDCGIEYSRLTLDLFTVTTVLEKYIVKLGSGILFLIPIFLCNLGMDIVNISDIITWHIVRISFFKQLDVKKQMISHIASILIPLSIGMIYVPEYNYHKQYMYGIHFITSYAIDIFMIVSRISLFIFSNLLFILLLFIDINNVFITVKNLMNHINVVFK